MQEITLYSHQGPNPWKVSILLEELNLPWKIQMIPTEDLKKPEYESINPNGRVPAIFDPNTNVTLWESNAILQYLVDKYDPSGRLTVTSDPEKYHLQQWLLFQASGQGPYFGQAAWFNHYHPEKVESAQKRYRNEVKRVLGVIDRALKGKNWLVGDKMTIADMSFLSWNKMVPLCLGPDMIDVEKEYPNYYRWDAEMRSLPSVTKEFGRLDQMMAAHKKAQMMKQQAAENGHVNGQTNGDYKGS